MPSFKHYKKRLHTKFLVARKALANGEARSDRKKTATDWMTSTKVKNECLRKERRLESQATNSGWKCAGIKPINNLTP